MSAIGTNAANRDERVARAERQLAIAQQITHIGSWEWDASTNAVSWSDELYRIYGFEPNSREITLDFFLSRLHPDDRERVQREVAQALQRGDRFAYPERIVRPDGTIRELDTVGEAARDASGRVVGLIGTCRDVTDERQRDDELELRAEIVRNVQIGLGVWEVGDAADVATIRLVAFNPAAERIVGAELASHIGSTLREIVPYAAGGELERLLEGVARDGQVREANVLRSRDPKNPGRALAMKAFPLPRGRVGVALEDITAQTRARRMQEAEHRLLEMIASGAALGDILRELVLVIEEHAPPTIASVLLLDADGLRVRSGAAPNLPPELTRAIDGLPIGPAAGSCGTAAFTRRPVFVRDIDTDPLWRDYVHLTRPHGLRACWSTPILATDGRVLGTFALYFREVRDPVDGDRETIARATHLAGIAIERRQLEDQLRELSAHADSVREDERTGIAREIHDELGQALTAIKMDLAWIARRCAGEVPIDRDAVRGKLHEMSAMTDDVIQRVRRISAELRPGVLDDLGLFAAIEWQAGEFERRTGTTCVVTSTDGDARFDRALSTAAFRIFQEALTNVARHADASRVDVVFAREGDAVVLEVRDDGKGIPHEALHSPKSLGLLGMRERARRLGGEVTIAPATPRGTLVSLRLPIERRPS